MKGIKKQIAIKYMAKGGEVGDPAFDVNDPNSYLNISPEDKALFKNLTDEQMLSVFGNYAPTVEADSEKLKSLQDNFLSNYKGTAQYYVPKKGFTVKKEYDNYLSTITPKTDNSDNTTAGAGLLASANFKPKYPKVGTPEWDANQSVIETERQKRQYKADGGVIDGAINTDQKILGDKSKKTSTKGKDVAHDIALGTIDLGISTFAPDLIKEKDYNSKYGAHINKTTHGLSSVANNVAEGILHQIFPFTAGLSTGKKAVGSAISGGPDEAISKEQLGQEAGASMGGTLLGSVAGQGFKNGFGKNKNTTTPTQTPTEETTAIQEDKTVFDPNTLKDSDREGYDAAPDKEAYLKSIGYYDGTYQKLSTGGKVVGPGTAKSDDIPSKLDGGGFVVPAENKAKAEALREKYFGKPKKIASLRGGDQKVMLSNGEHYFTPEEVQVLKANGEDLDALAPNAEVNTDEYKCGGGVKKMAEGGSVGDPTEEEKPKRKSSSGIGSVDKMIDDLYSGKYKTKEEINTAKEKIKAITGVGKWSVGIGDNEAAKDAFMYAEKLSKEIEKKEKDSNAEKKFDNEINKYRSELKSAKYNREYLEEFDKTVSEIKSKKSKNGLHNEYFNAIKDASNKFEQLKSRRSKENEKIGEGVLKEKASELIKDVDKRVQKKYSEYEKVKNNPENYTPSQIKKAKDDFEDEYDFRESLKSYNNVKKGYIDVFSKYSERYKVDVKAGNIKPTEKSKQNTTEQNKKEKTAPSPYAPESLKTESKVTPSPVKTNGGLGSGVKDAVTPKTTTGASGSGSKTTTKTDTKPASATTTPATGGVVAVATKNKTPESADAEDNTPTYDGLENGYFGGDKPTSKKDETKKGILGDGLGLEKAIALGQMALGAQQLLSDGKRPVDQLDSEFVSSVEQAKKDAEFGMSPLERSIAERNMVRQQRGGVRAIVQQSAGNSQQAINSIIALNNEAANNAQLLSLRSEQLLAEKKRYRDTLVGQQSAMKKQLFNEKLEAFNIDQQAGANLLGAGISNVIGASRYQKLLEAEKEIAEKKNTTFDPEQLSRILNSTNTPATS